MELPRNFLNGRGAIKVGDITKETVDAIVNAANGTLMGGGGGDGAIHCAGGPDYGQGGEAKSQLLAACYANSLALAVENSLHSIAFPAISTGVYGYPLSEAAVVSSSTIEQYLKNETTIQEVRLVFFAGSDAEVFVRHQRFSR